MKLRNVDIEANLDAVHRPILHVARWDHARLGIGLAWGPKWCDPVWSIYVSVPIPKRFR